MMLSINDKKLVAITLLMCLTFMSSSSFASGAAASVFRFQQTMADRGLPQAQYKLAMMYESGIGVEKSLIHAKIWYGRAALQDFKPARHRLTYLDMKQHGVQSQHADWVADLKRDAMFGDGEALFLLGQMYADGVGIGQNLRKSLELLRKASAGNVAGSESELLRVETIYLAQKEQAEQQRRQQAAERKQVEQEQQRQQIEQQRQRRLEQQRMAREKQLIAQRQHQLELARKRQAEAQRALAEQQARQAAVEAMLITETQTGASTICSGNNRFSATCR
jgi:TPR repeat protein